MARVLLWWVGGIWAGVGLLLVLLYLCYEVFGSPSRGWRQRLRDLAFLLPLALGWPVVITIAVFQIRRDVVLERACYGGSRWRPGPTTEMQWLRGRDSVRLLAGLPLGLSERKRRLFACACCRRIWERLDDDRSRRAVEVAERLADGEAAPDEVRLASGAAGAAASVLLTAGELESGAAAKAAQDCLSGDGLAAADRAAVSKYRSRRRERRAQCELLHEIVGNPFRPLPARTFPPELVELARAVHEGDHALYPLLADALEEMGEPDAADHCRTGKHLRGCHVVDWVLGWG